MADTNMDNITIKVNVEDGGASGKLDSIAQSLSRLSQATRDVDTTHLSDVGAALKGLNSIVLSAHLTNSISNLSSALSTLGATDTTRLGNISASVEKLNGVQISNTVPQTLEQMRASLNGFKIDRSAIKSIERVGDAINAFPSSMDKAAAITNLATAMEKISTVQPIGSTVFSNLKSLKTTLDSMTGAATTMRTLGSGMLSFAKGVEKLITNLTNLQNVDLSKLRELADIISKMQNVGPLKISIHNGDAKAKTDDAGDTNRSASSMNNLASSSENARSKIASLRETLAGVGRTGLKAGGILAKAFMSPMYGVGKAISGITSKMKGFLTTIKRVVFLRLLRQAIMSVIQGIGEGIKNLYNWSKTVDGTFKKSMDKISTSMLYLKNSFAAMLSPLINSLAPAIDFLVDKIVDFLNLINMLFARLSGATTWTKAVKKAKEFSAATGSAASNADALKRSLLKIDEINALNDPNSGSGGGGGSSGTDTSGMFETETLDNFTDGLNDVWDVFKKSWEQKGKQTWESIKGAIESVKNLIGDMKESFREVFTNGTGLETLNLIFSIIGNIADSISGLSDSFDKAWKKAGVGTSIVQGIWNIVNELLGLVDDITADFEEWAENVDFTPMLKSIDEIVRSLKPLVSTARGTLTWLYENILVPLATWVIEDVVPEAFSDLAIAIEVVSGVAEDLVDVYKDMWDKLEDLRKVIKKLTDIELKALKRVLQDIRDIFDNEGWKQIFENIGSIPVTIANALTPAEESFDSFGEVLGRVIDAVGLVVTFFEAGVIIITMMAKKLVQAIMLVANALDIKSAVLDHEGYIKKVKTSWEDLTSVEWDSRIALEDVADTASKLWDQMLHGKSKLEETGDSTNKLTDKMGNLSKSLKKVDDDGTETYDDLTSTYSGFGDWWDKHVTSPLSTKSGKSWDNVKKQSFDTKKGITEELSKIPNDAETKSFNPLGEKWKTCNSSIKKEWGSTYTGLGKDLSEVPGKFETAFNGGYNSVAKAFSSTGSLASGVETGINNSFKTFLNKIISGLNNVFSRTFGKISNLVTSLRNWTVLGTQPFKGLPSIPIPYIPYLASGGILPDRGQLFIANERGPELVSTFGNRSAVMNNDQIVQSVTDGVAKANSTQNMLLTEQNRILMQLLAKEGTVRAVVSTADIVNGINNLNRRSGRQIIPVNG